VRFAIGVLRSCILAATAVWGMVAAWLAWHHLWYLALPLAIGATVGLGILWKVTP